MKARQSVTQGLAGLNRDLKGMFQDVATQCRGVILSYTLPDGTVDKTRRAELLRRCGEITQRAFVGANMRDAYIDETRPLAPFPRILNKWYAYIVKEAITTQSDWLKRNTMPELFAWLERAPVSIQVKETSKQERQREAIEAMLFDARNLLAELPRNELLEYDPMHTWVDPRGKQLSDRIWDASIRTRTKIDALLTEGIQAGEGSLSLSRKLERFLLPDRAQLRTVKPYGIDASYDALRLARSEIAEAHNRAAELAANLNPYVDRYDVRRSANGDPKCPICPQHATIDIGGNRVREPYKLGDGTSPIFHANCRCVYVARVTDNPRQVTDRLWTDYRQGNPAPRSNASISKTLLALLGTYLFNEYVSNRSD